MKTDLPGNSQRIPKFRVPVRIRFADNASLVGLVFVRQGQRVIDLMCDDRGFIPIIMTSGTTLANKAHIRQVDVLSLQDIVEIQDTLPKFDLAYLNKNSW